MLRFFDLGFWLLVCYIWKDKFFFFASRRFLFVDDKCHVGDCFGNFLIARKATFFWILIYCNINL